MPDLVKCALTLARDTGLPEDRVVMSFWFRDMAGDTALAPLASRVRDWLLVDNSETAAPLQGHLGSGLSTSGHFVHCYTYDEVTGERLTFPNDAPQYSLAFSITPSSDAGPSEVAVCLSYRNNTGAVPGGGEFLAPLAQRRGRIYFGPLNGGNMTAGGMVAGDARPQAVLLTCLLGNSQFLQNDVQAPGFEWIIYSRPFAGRGEVERPGRPTLPALPARPGKAYLIEQFWCDDAFDTQRRRGAQRSFRTFLDVLP